MVTGFQRVLAFPVPNLAVPAGILVKSARASGRRNHFGTRSANIERLFGEKPRRIAAAMDARLTRIEQKLEFR